MIFSRLNAQQENLNAIAIKQQEVNTTISTNQAETLRIMDQKITGLGRGELTGRNFGKMK